MWLPIKPSESTSRIFAGMAKEIDAIKLGHKKTVVGDRRKRTKDRRKL